MKYISLSEVMWKLVKNPLLRNITIEDAAEHAYSLIKLLRIPLTFVTVTEVLMVEDYKVRLPESLVDVLGIRHVDSNRALTYGASVYHTSTINKPKNEYCDNYTYILQNCNIITSFEKGKVEISYKTMATDDDGLPLIPDNQSFIKAIEYDIMMNYMEPLWMMGKISDRAFQRSEQQRDWYVGQASSALKVTNFDHLDMVMSGLNRIVVNTQARESFYEGHGTKEQIKQY